VGSSIADADEFDAAGAGSAAGVSVSTACPYASVLAAHKIAIFNNFP
jgi:hypothetical protein